MTVDAYRVAADSLSSLVVAPYGHSAESEIP
jgi:hypothetical protein